MHLSIALAFLVSSTSAHTPKEVKEELDAHPWRPAPKMVVISSQSSATTATKAPAASASVGDVWQLQIAALSSLDAAKAEQKRVEKIVGTGKVEIITEGSVNRVRLGAYPSKDAAEAAREEMRPKGIEGFPVHKL